MAKKTFGGMYKKIVRQCGLTNTFSDGLDETASIKEDINDIQKQVLSMSKTYLKKAGILISGGTVIGQNNYTIPSSIDKITTIKVTSGGVNYYPVEISPTLFHALDSTGATSDIPIYWTIDKTELYLYPTPETTLLPIELNANEYATDLEIDPDSSDDIGTSLEIKEGKENVIYYYALNEAFSRLEDFASADRYEKKYEKLYIEYKKEVRNPTNNIVVGGGKAKIIDPNLNPTLTN